jgi:hypothetical protein
MKYKRVVELGVGGGDFSSVLAKSNITELVLVDKWNDHHDEAEHQRVVNRFRNDTRVKIFHSTFEEASKNFPDEYFDFVYIDGYAHTGQDNGLTLLLWWYKVRTGGFFGGHDYHINYPKTISVVDSFCKAYNKTMNLTGEEKFPSWYVFK